MELANGGRAAAQTEASDAMQLLRWFLVVGVLLAGSACEDDPNDLVLQDAGAGSGGSSAGAGGAGAGGAGASGAGSGGAGSGGAGAGGAGAGAGG